MVFLFHFRRFWIVVNLLLGECRPLFTHREGDTLNSIMVDMSGLNLSIVRVIRRQFQSLSMLLILIIHIWLQFGG